MQITTDSFEFVAAKCYQKRLCLSTKAFLSDVQALDLRKDFTRYINSREPRLIRLIINKMIIAGNLFGPDSVELVLFKLSDEAKILASHFYHELGLVNQDFTPDEEIRKVVRDALKNT